MKSLDWNAEKNEWLKAERGVCFDDVAAVITKLGVLAVVENPNQNKYPGQRMFVINIDGYVYLVPFVEDKEKVFLKTVIPSRKMTKKYFT